MGPGQDMTSARTLCQNLLKHVEALSEQIAELEKGLRMRARRDEVASRLMTIPGVGAICATAIEALVPSAETFSKGRDLEDGDPSARDLPERADPSRGNGCSSSPGGTMPGANRRYPEARAPYRPPERRYQHRSSPHPPRHDQGQPRRNQMRRLRRLGIVARPRAGARPQDLSGSLHEMRRQGRIPKPE